MSILTVHYIPVKINLAVAVLVKVQYHKRLSSSHAWGSKQSCVKNAPTELGSSRIDGILTAFCERAVLPTQPPLYTDLSIQFYYKVSGTQQNASRAELRCTARWRQRYMATIAGFQSISDNRIFYRKGYIHRNKQYQAYRCTFQNMLHGCSSTTLKIMFRLACTNTQEKLHRHKMASFFLKIISFKKSKVWPPQQVAVYNLPVCKVSTSEYWFGCNGSKSLE